MAPEDAYLAELFKSGVDVTSFGDAIAKSQAAAAEAQQRQLAAQQAQKQQRLLEQMFANAPQAPNSQAMLPDLMRIAGQSGDLQKIIALMQQGTEMRGQDRLAEQADMKAITDLAKISPEIATSMWEQKGYGQRFGPITDWTGAYDIEGNPKSGMFRRTPGGGYEILQEPQYAPRNGGNGKDKRLNAFDTQTGTNVIIKESDLDANPERYQSRKSANDAEVWAEEQRRKNAPPPAPKKGIWDSLFGSSEPTPKPQAAAPKQQVKVLASGKKLVKEQQGKWVLAQ